MPDTDWIITIGGKDVSGDVNKWRVKDAEEGASQIEVTLRNTDDKYTDAFKEDDEVEIRHGYVNDLSEPATLPLKVINPKFPTKGYPTITLIGRDPTHKLGGGCHRGKHKNNDSSLMINDELKANGFQTDGGGSGAKIDNQGAMNENSDEFLYRLLPSIGGPHGGGHGDGPKSPMAGEKSSNAEGTDMERDQGLSWSSPAGLHENGRDFDDNRGKQTNNSHGSEPLTAKLDLVGYPKLKGKTCVDVLDYGSTWSGTWYAKEVEHGWDKSKGYCSNADLIRSGTGKGGVGGEPPIVMYAELYQKNKIYRGPRKSNQAPSCTFMRGDGIIIDFEPRLNSQPQRGAGEPGKGKGRGLDIRDELKDFEDGPGAQQSSGAGNDASSGQGALSNIG